MKVLPTALRLVFLPLFLGRCAALFLDADLYGEELEPVPLGRFYKYQFRYKDNENRYHFKATDGELPAGMSVTSKGILMGTPQEAGVFEFQVTLVETATSVSNFDLDCLFVTPSDCQNDDQNPISDGNGTSEKDSEWFVLTVIEGEDEGNGTDSAQAGVKRDRPKS